MKYIQILPLAVVATAFVIPDEQLTNQIVLETKEAIQDVAEIGENALDRALKFATETVSSVQSAFETTESDVQSWFSDAMTTPFEGIADDLSSLEEDRPGHRRPRHGHHGPSNKTVYELIASSKYTTKLAELINEFDDLVQLLNGTAANYTVFAPTNAAFEKIPKHLPKPSKEVLKKILSYHVSPEFYPARRVLASHTIPTALVEESLGGPQRLRVDVGLHLLTLNYLRRLVALDIFGSNGVIHGIDTILIPPPKASKIIELLPGEFSTLQLALVKTGLAEKLATGEHVGGTLFAPSNFAFKKLGPKINAFLFSSYGEKYLNALLRYHVVVNQTLYSDAFYGNNQKSSDFHTGAIFTESNYPPRRSFHVDLPTLFGDRSLSIDVQRTFGRFITILINGFSGVSIADGLAKDGAIHVLSTVLIPPRTKGSAGSDDIAMDGEMDLDEFKERLEPYVYVEEL